MLFVKTIIKIPRSKMIQRHPSDSEVTL